MKQKLNFATGWRYFSGRSIRIAFSTTFRALKWRYQVAILNLCFIEASLNFLRYHMQKTFLHIFIQKKVPKFLSGAKKRPIRSGDYCTHFAGRSLPPK